MSNTIRYDSLLVRALAAELDAVLAGARLTAAFLERDLLRVTLRMRTSRHRAPAAPPALLWQLHPSSGHLTQAGADTAAHGRIQLAAPAVITGVSAPADERLIVIELETAAADAPAGVVRRIIIELITNQWNAIAIGADDRIVAVLRERDTKVRQLRAGVEYHAPTASGRIGAHGGVAQSEWLETLGAAKPADRQRALLQFAYTGPINAAAILGDAAVEVSETALLRALDRYTAMVVDPEQRAYVVLAGGHWQPYPVPVGTVAEPAASLLDAFAVAAERGAAPPAAGAVTDAALDAVARRMDALSRRAERLRQELDGAGTEAQQFRHHADLILAQLQRVPRGATAVELDDFAGGTVQLALDPALSAADNAARLYDSARRRDRAAARIPGLQHRTATELARLEALAGRIRDGTARSAEIERVTGSRAARSRDGRSAAGRDGASALPYREYRTSSGIEVRVGRGSKANDDLTFRHASPTDIWLHARDVAGAHVILRWQHASANPAAADIAEAAVLAALHSRARTSGLVAVDWTRRRYVRKPRKAGPGLVIPERVRTVFVEPDARTEERLRVDPLVQD